MSGTQVCFIFFWIPDIKQGLSSFVAKFCLIPGRRALNELNRRLCKNYITPSGAVPFEVWISGLKDPVTRHRIKTRLDRVEKGNLGDHRPVGEGVLELKLDFGPGHRIYFVEE